MANQKSLLLANSVTKSPAMADAHGFLPFQHMLENGKNNNNMGEEERHKVIKRAMDERFHYIQLMLRMTGLIYFIERRPFWRYVKKARAAVLIGLAVYQTCYILKILLDHGQFDLMNARSLILFSWQLQALISMGFMIYFQERGHLVRLRECIHCQDGCPLTPKVIKKTIILYCSLLVFTSITSLAVIILKCQGFTEADSIVDDALYEVYGTNKLVFLSLGVHLWAMYVWVAALSFFISVVTALHHELCAFNYKKLIKYSLQQIGQDVEEGDMDAIALQLEKCYVRHVELANRIRVINDTFEVYTFTMLGANVPTTIFCLMAFLISYQSSSWLSVIIGIPELMFCLFELIGLTSSPAKVHAAIAEVESIIYKNMRIWTPYNDKVYRLASVFIAVDFGGSSPRGHSNQPNLGITLWGFAVVTKPLILTMISLTISYLTFVLQVRPERAMEGGNQSSTLHFTFN